MTPSHQSGVHHRMSRCTALVAALLAWAVIADPRALAQPKMMIVVLDAAGQPHVFFQPRTEPLANPEASVPPVSVSAGQNGRMADGAIVAAIGFTGWNEGTGFRVVALALVRPSGAAW